MFFHISALRFSRTLGFLALTLSMAFCFKPVWAHGDWLPKFGGVMNDGGETSFELVVEGQNLVAYVSDHGEPLNLAGATAEIKMHTSSQIYVTNGIIKGSRIVYSSARLASAEKITLKLSSPDIGILFGRFSPALTSKLNKK